MRMQNAQSTRIAPLFRGLAVLALILATVAATGPARAQGLYDPVAQINDSVVTKYELDQRIRFMRLLNSPGDVEKDALEALVNERLQLDTARRLGLLPSAAAVDDGMAEFAARGELSTEQFIQAIAGGGVAAESFRDFVRAGQAWRSIVGERFRGRVQVSEAEIDRALATASPTSSARVLLSEIFLRADNPANKARSEKLAENIQQITTLPAFAAAARKYSAAPSRGRGGRIDWVPLANLPPAIASTLLTLKVGEVTQPLQVPNAIALFQLRALEETKSSVETASSVEYAAYYIPGGQSQAALAQAQKIRDRVDTCDDLYGVAKGQPEETLQRDTLPIAEVPGDVAIELAKLDEGEVSTALTRANGQTLVFLMLCSRGYATAENDVSREQIREQLISQRLNSYADGYLAELRADAAIQYK